MNNWHHRRNSTGRQGQICNNISSGKHSRGQTEGILCTQAERPRNLKNNIHSESCSETLNHSQIFSQPWHSYCQMECYI